MNSEVEVLAFSLLDPKVHEYSFHLTFKYVLQNLSVTESDSGILITGFLYEFNFIDSNRVIWDSYFLVSVGDSILLNLLA